MKMMQGLEILLWILAGMFFMYILIFTFNKFLLWILRRRIEMMEDDLKVANKRLLDFKNKIKKITNQK